MGEYDVAVIGAGHAGVECALISAKMGLKVGLFTISLDSIANMPCNPSIGGTAKGHLVREIDALGGEMGKAADETFLQSRILNKGKGPAVHSLRVQADREKYHSYMKQVLEDEQNIDIKQDEIVDIKVNEKNEISQIITRLGASYKVKTTVICCGTYLNATIHVGNSSMHSGPDGNISSLYLTQNLNKLGIKTRRFKTGTPARIHSRSIDFDKLEIQEGDEKITPFSFETNKKLENTIVCHIAYTNQDTHKVILDNLHRSAMYGGKIDGVGPRYCPSIEDKIVRFADKERHQIFVEPMGLGTKEIYLQGMSSSLPEDVQLNFLHTIKGFENAQVMRNAYAIEYDCCDSTQLLPTLEFKNIRGLYGAGQFNGTSGYEEAAAQGLVAGINASLKVLGKKQFVLDRASSYIGTLIDDLVIKGCSDPYRMMTSRSEYRLILRQDNADERLTPLARELGLINDERWEKFNKKMELIKQERERLKKVVIKPNNDLNEILVSRGTTEMTTGVKAEELIRRPQISYNDIAQFDETRPKLPYDVIEQVEIQIKYEGYIKKQLSQVKEMRKLEQKPLPKDIIYKNVLGLRLEAQEKLEKVKPLNIGQASRISGVSPADISVLLIWLEQQKQNKEKIKSDK